MFHLDQVHMDEVLEQGDGYGVMRVLMGAECAATGKKFDALRDEPA